jgi:hypothetical protein
MAWREAASCRVNSTVPVMEKPLSGCFSSAKKARSWGGKVILTESVEGQSTTKTIQKIKK